MAPAAISRLTVAPPFPLLPPTTAAIPVPVLGARQQRLAGAQDYSTNNTFTMENLKCGSYTVAAYALRGDVGGNWGAAYVKAFVINVNSSVSLYAPANVSPGGSNLTPRPNALPAWSTLGTRPRRYLVFQRCSHHKQHHSFTAATSGTYRL